MGRIGDEVVVARMGNGDGDRGAVTADPLEFADDLLKMLRVGAPQKLIHMPVCGLFAAKKLPFVRLKDETRHYNHGRPR